MVQKYQFKIQNSFLLNRKEMYIAVSVKIYSLLEKYMLPCLTKKYFGIDCIGCGLQRSIAFLLKGEFLEAFYMYPAIYPLILLISFIGFNFFFQFKYDWKIKLTLIMLTASTMIISYFIKMKIFF